MSCRTSFLPPGVNIEYRLDLSPAAQDYREMLRQLDRDVLFPLLRLPQLTDLKGNGPQDILLELRGRAPSDPDLLPFSWTISTSFLDFPERELIRFRWQEKAEPDMFEGIDRYTLLNKDEVIFDGFSLHLAAYKTTVITRLSGFGPVAAETLSIEADNSSLSLTITSEGLPDLSATPLAGDDLFGRMDTFLQSSLNFSLKSDYRAHQGVLA